MSDLSVKKSRQVLCSQKPRPTEALGAFRVEPVPSLPRTASEHIPLQRPPPWVLRRTPKGLGRVQVHSPHFPGATLWRVSGLDSQALQDPVSCSCSTMLTAVGRSFLRCCRLPSRGCRDTQGTRRELWAALWKLPKGVGSPAEPNSSTWGQDASLTLASWGCGQDESRSRIFITAV